MSASEKLLIIDNDKYFIEACQERLQQDFNIHIAATAIQAKEDLRKITPDIVLFNIYLNQEESDETNDDGVRLLKELLEISPTPIIVMSLSGDASVVVKCMRVGAVDFIEKPIKIATLHERIKRVLKENKTSRVAIHLEERLKKFESSQIIGFSKKVEKLRQQIKVVAQDGRATVLIRGEPGTGKELVARAIHKNGWRNNDPIVTVNIAALAPDLIASELFGYEKGAFTGAAQRHIGYFEKAKGGVLFLDEIGELNNEIQVKLLRFLQERTFCRVGSTDEQEIDIQLVMATNRNLEEALLDKSVREDFYYRIKQFEIFLPPLRDRIEDVDILVPHFLHRFRQQGRSKIVNISKKAVTLLKSHQWPGNVRELETVLGRAIIYANFHNHSEIEEEDLALETIAPKKNKEVGLIHIPPDGIDLSEELAKCEFLYIEEALKISGGRKIEAGKLLGFNNRFALRRRVKNLIQNYPSLIEDFPLVRDLYQKDDE